MSSGDLFVPSTCTCIYYSSTQFRSTIHSDNIAPLSFPFPHVHLALVTPHLFIPYLATGRPGPEPLYDCGNSFADAVAKDCVFNSVSIAWQPRACSAAFTDEYLSYAGGRPYQDAADQASSNLLGHEELSHFEEDWYWMSKRARMALCAFVLLCIYDAIEKGDRIDSIVASSRHAESCIDNMLELMPSTPEWDEINTTSKVRYLSC